MIADCERLVLRFWFFYTEPVVSPGSISESELEDLLAAESDAANRHRIERGVLVPCPLEKVERLRAGASPERALPLHR
ncbi:MAG TPA: hypothetical protein VGB13_02065 [Candidatus Krumholzibacteria bacterium]|jgi:hypothetical protein